MRMPVRSRIGNALLAVIGAVYICAAVSLLVYAVAQTWEAASTMDYAVQLILIGSAAAGVFFLVNGAANLGLHHPIAALKRVRSVRQRHKAAEAHP